MMIKFNAFWMTSVVLSIICKYAHATDFCEQLFESPCLNGGECVNTETEYVCDCSTIDFEGDRCEIAIDDCPAVDPCQNGGECLDGDGEYSCICPSGYASDHCENDIDECLIEPCDTDHTIGGCVNTPGSYVCDCENGWQGTHCDERDYDECADDPCEHSGNCTDGYNTFTCQCKPVYMGDTCHILPNNVTHYTLDDSGCQCPDTEHAEGCACCVTSPHFEACPCNRSIDATVCVLCSDNQNRFTDWCTNQYPPDPQKYKSKQSFLARTWKYFTIGAVAFVSLVILIVLIAKGVQVQRKRKIEQEKAEEAAKEREFKNTVHTTNGARNTGGNTWGAWDTDALVEVG